ncbi:MAG: hypothetical protein R3F03_14785 [Opitutaceae bacterium]
MAGLTQKYSKRRIAEIQIGRAIKVLAEAADEISAITLAGAAEEILGQKLRATGIPCALDHDLAFNKCMWGFAAKRAQEAGQKIVIPDDRALRDGANRARNELKHLREGRPLVAIFDYEAEEMILRALHNYCGVYGSPPPQKFVQTWYESHTPKKA